VRLNIGCGTAPTDGWLNYDNSPSVRLAAWPPLWPLLRLARLIDDGNVEFARLCRQHGIRYANAASRIPHSDGSVDVVYSSHMIEHLDRHEASRFLTECRRVLKKEGVLRVVVPDLRVPVNDYVARGNAELFVDQLQLALDRPHGLGNHVRNLLLGGRRHRWLYDGPSMRRLLLASGFERVEVLEPGQTRIAQPGALDLFERAGASAYVEAERGG
jgi:predicted SAM-dependent methyltransferase